jgi:hypothetical protein
MPHAQSARGRPPGDRDQRRAGSRSRVRTDDPERDDASRRCAAGDGLDAGAVVFTPPNQPVPLDANERWWSYVEQAS